MTKGQLTCIVGGLRTLIYCNTGCESENIALGPQRFAKLNRICRIESSCAIIPALEGCVTEGRFGNGNTLPFACWS